MAKRLCRNCGKEEEESGGSVCPSGHFVCRDCMWSTIPGPFLESGINECPVCHGSLKPLSEP